MQGSRKHHTVLMVEDDPLEIELARNAVIESGLELALVVLKDADAVLDWLSDGTAKSQQMPRVILINLKLPKLDGLAILRKLRMHSATSDTPIVAFSAEYIQAEVLMSYRAGANSFVAKPADLHQFGEFFREQIPYWLEPRQRKLAFAADGRS
ncbi:two-component system response regulator [Ferrigenium kumadai]|uniref:Two-component system response regulator n=1 Tax=Ferrigenium kumadai TaxID=1682490 RepID=A0AAN1T0K2_9PROT|nr:response regulator [Ferrigenium kumadai]BBI99164.1 two-component system response regulator [Ferrigenium kumadai]